MKPFQPKFVKIAVLLADGSTAVMSFCTMGRGSALTRRDGNIVPGMLWVDKAQGIWARPDTDANVADEINYTYSQGGFAAAPVSWQRVTDDAAQHDRDYRAAVKYEGGRLVHDMVKARECKRGHIREQRTHEFARLDAEWMKAQGQKKNADTIEAERQSGAMPPPIRASTRHRPSRN